MKALKISLLVLALLLAALAAGLQYYLNRQIAEMQQSISQQRAAFFKMKALALSNDRAHRDLEQQLRERNAVIQAAYDKLNAASGELVEAVRARLEADKAANATATAARVTRGRYTPSQPSARPGAVATAETPAPAGPSMEDVREAAAARADTYFRYEYRPGSSATLSISVTIDTDEPEPMPGWPGEYHVRGIGQLSFFDSKGIAFSNATERFEATVKTAGGAARVTDFHLTLP